MSTWRPAGNESASPTDGATFSGEAGDEIGGGSDPIVGAMAGLTRKTAPQGGANGPGNGDQRKGVGWGVADRGKGAAGKSQSLGAQGTKNTQAYQQRTQGIMQQAMAGDPRQGGGQPFGGQQGRAGAAGGTTLPGGFSPRARTPRPGPAGGAGGNGRDNELGLAADPAGGIGFDAGTPTAQVGGGNPGAAMDGSVRPTPANTPLELTVNRQDGNGGQQQVQQQMDVQNASAQGSEQKGAGAGQMVDALAGQGAQLQNTFQQNLGAQNDLGQNLETGTRALGGDQTAVGQLGSILAGDAAENQRLLGIQNGDQNIMAKNMQNMAQAAGDVGGAQQGLAAAQAGLQLAQGILGAAEALPAVIPAGLITIPNPAKPPAMAAAQTAIRVAQMTLKIIQQSLAAAQNEQMTAGAKNAADQPLDQMLKQEQAQNQQQTQDHQTNLEQRQQQMANDQAAVTQQQKQMQTLQNQGNALQGQIGQVNNHRQQAANAQKINQGNATAAGENVQQLVKALAQLHQGAGGGAGKGAPGNAAAPAAAPSAPPAGGERARAATQPPVGMGAGNFGANQNAGAGPGQQKPTQAGTGAHPALGGQGGGPQTPGNKPAAQPPVEGAGGAGAQGGAGSPGGAAGPAGPGAGVAGAAGANGGAMNPMAAMMMAKPAAMVQPMVTSGAGDAGGGSAAADAGASAGGAQEAADVPHGNASVQSDQGTVHIRLNGLSDGGSDLGGGTASTGGAGVSGASDAGTGGDAGGAGAGGGGAEGGDAEKVEPAGKDHPIGSATTAGAGAAAGARAPAPTPA